MEDLDIGGLAKARRVLLGVMRTKGAKMLFNEAVDPEAMGLPDYLEVISHPIDLGTILGRLERGLDLSSDHRKFERSTTSNGADDGQRSMKGKDRNQGDAVGKPGGESAMYDVDRQGYSNPGQVLEDVCRVWDNCYRYNSRDCDAPTRAVCDEVKKSFERAWRANGLKPSGRDGGRQISRSSQWERVDSSIMPPNGSGGGTTSLKSGCRQTTFKERSAAENCFDEQSVPDKFSIRADWSDLPLRMLDNFSLLHENHFISLDKMGATGCSGMAAKGNLVADSSFADGNTNGGSGCHPIQLKDLLDWSIQYGDSPGIWVITKHAWYRLLNPSKEYEGFLSPMLGKVVFCIKASQLQRNQAQTAALKDEPVDAAVDTILSNSSSLSANGIENKKELMAFAHKQLCSWLRVIRQTKSDSGGAKTQKSSSSHSRGGADLSFKTQGLRSSSRKRPRPVALNTVQSDTTRCPHDYPAKSSPHKIYTGIDAAEDVAEDDSSKHELVKYRFAPEVVADTLSRYTRASFRQKYPSEKLDSGVDGKSDIAHGMHETSSKSFVTSDKLQEVECEEMIQTDQRYPELSEHAMFSSLESPASGYPDVQCEQDATTQAIESDGSGVTYPDDSHVHHDRQMHTLTARRRASALNLVDISDSSDSEDAPASKKRKKLSDFERKRLRRAKEDRARLRKDLRIDEDRADPPPAKRIFRVEGAIVGEILSIWEFLMAFAGILQVPPFPYWRLEAAISPLCMTHQKGFKGPVVDLDGLASGILLRDVHTGLLRLVEGKGSNAEPPVAAKLVDDDRGGSGLWFQKISLFLLRAPLDEVDEEARIIGQFLQTHDYVELDPYGRVKILKTLMDLSLGTELIRDNINGYMEGGGAQKKRMDGHDDPKYVDSMEMSDLRETCRGDSVVQKWTEWTHSCKLGFMKILGEDIRGRKYWTLGGHAGAWKIFVETPPEYTLDNEPDDEHPHKGPQSQWGWYDAHQFGELVAWLDDWGIVYEKPLVDLLEKIPEAPKLVLSRHGHQNSGDAQTYNNPLKSLTDEWPNGHHHASTHDELEGLRPDGYRSIIAPHFRGEGECSELTHASPIEIRIMVSIQSMLGLVPFWMQGQQLLGNTICSVIRGLQGARTILELSQQLLQVENILSSYGCLRDTWGDLWQVRWRSSLQQSNSVEETAMHVVTLQDFLKGDCYRLHRTAFNAYAAEARCPLYFPLPVENVVFLRTGCLLHLQKYLALGDSSGYQCSAASGSKEDSSKADLPLGEEVGSNQDLQSSKERVEKLRPVERFKISCISYRSPFACEYPKSSSTSQMENSEPPQMQCLWLLMQPATLQPGAVSDAVAVPIHIDNTLADFVVKIGTFDQGTQKVWKAGERFRMFFGGKSSRGGQGGVYYKGTVVTVEGVKPGMEYDSWESITVEWDNDNSESSLMKVSPWEIEVDPEEEQRLEEERRREEEARSRAARAAAKQQRTDYIASLGAYEGASSSPNDPDFDPEMDIPGLGRNRRRGTSMNEMVYYDPSNPVGPVPPAVIEALPDQDGFTILIYNFMKRLKGKFKCPIFAGHELDLHRVFHEVQDRGGYDRVTQLKLWKEVCRTLNVNLTGQTSASYNMRLNYEKCLLDFEHYLAKGEYTREVAEGTAPSSTRLDSAPALPKTKSPTRPPSPPSAFHSTDAVARAPQQILQHSVNQLHGNRSQAHVRDLGQVAPASFSMTELLFGDEYGQDYGRSAHGSAWEAAGNSANNPSWLRMLAPASTSTNTTTSGSAPVNPQVPEGWAGVNTQVCNVDTPLVEPCSNEEAYAAALGPVKPPMVEVQPGESIGMALNRMGRALVGADLWRRWPDCSAERWFKATVADFRLSSNEHCLVYNRGTDGIKTEWTDLRDMESEELSQFEPEEVARGLPRNEPEQAVDIQPTSSHSLNTSEGPFHSLGTPPPIHQFGAAKAPQGGLGHSLVLGRGDRHTGASARQLISQMIQMGVNPDHVKLIDSNQTSLLAHVSETFGQQVEGVKSPGQSICNRRMEFGNLPGFSSHNHFSVSAEHSERVTLPGCDGKKNCVSTDQLQLNSASQDVVDLELQLSLAANQELMCLPALDQFVEEKQLSAVSGPDVERCSAEGWQTDHEVGSAGDSPKASSILKTQCPQQTWSGIDNSPVSKEQISQKSEAEEEVHPTTEPVMDEYRGDPRKSDMFKIKISVPGYKQ